MLIVHVTWKVLQFAEDFIVNVKFAPWNWDKTDWEVWQARCRTYVAPQSWAMHMSSRNPIIFDCIIHQHEMKNICAADKIIYGHSDFRSYLYSMQCFRTPKLPTFPRNRVSIWRWHLSLCGGAALRSFILYLPGQRDFSRGERKTLLRFPNKWSRFWINCGQNTFS